ncbi:MAG: biopolymer transporter ExbD [Bacteroidetes bacterium]|nr:biopolymer transporter ExbD [Bacteroidota bacterium]
MAEIDTSGGGKKKGPGVKKGKKLSTRIDLTPMVDLGFLLITFFIFTTTMSKPKTMEINMPVDTKDDSTKAKDYCTMTILLSKEHRVYYYVGLADDPMNPPKVEVTYFQNKNGIRDALILHKKNVDEQRMNGMPGHIPADKPVILIKPDVNSQYEDMVNILDEMKINDMPIYAMIDITPVDQNYIKATEAANEGQ